MAAFTAAALISADGDETAGWLMLFVTTEIGWPVKDGRKLAIHACSFGPDGQVPYQKQIILLI